MVICKSSRLPYTWEILNVTLLQSYVVTKVFGSAFASFVG